MGSRLACSSESPVPKNIKEQVVKNSEQDTLYGENFDGIPSRIMKTPLGVELMKNRKNIFVIFYHALRASQKLNIPLSKVLLGLVFDYKNIFLLAQFGAATEKLITASIEGDLKNGIQFIGQTQGLINDIDTVENILERIIKEADEARKNTDKFF